MVAVKCTYADQIRRLLIGYSNSLTDDAVADLPTARSPSTILAQWLPLDSLCRGSSSPPRGTGRYVYIEPASDCDGLSELSIDLAEITSELGLHPDMDASDIAQIRRRFAARSHPDRVTSELREIATIRMQVANALLDEFLRTLHNKRHSVRTSSFP